MQPKNQSNYTDSVRAWASAYRDSVIIDVHYNSETGFENIYIHKDHVDSWKGGVEDKQGLAVTEWQYWMVPTFFAIMFALIIFAFILYRDNDRALKQKQTDKIMSFIKNK